ncbi:MAG TPA: ABC transporter ATP-binding protein [Actinomycetota bacterium]|nr:ABC transporter ATP-binding protein [Actinomycetota bacterium]
MRVERVATRDLEAPALVADGVSVELGRRPIVTGASFEVGTGSWTCVIGPNGAGKTTLVHALAGVVPSTGSISLWGAAPSSLGRRARARAIALVPQLPTIPDGVTVEHYVLLGRTPHLGILGGERRHDHDVVADALERLDLAWARDRRLETLSGGELRRVVLARALAQEAPLLLLDEPTTGLDLGQQLRVLELVDELRREHGLTVLSTMHDLTLAGRFADRFVLLSGGRVVAAGARDEVLSTHVIAEHYGAAVRIVDGGDLGWAVVPIPERER